METRLPRFVRALRSAGVRVSTSEEVDAASAISILGLPDRTTFRATLFTTLIKDPRDHAAFERLFAAFFDAPAALDLAAGDPAAWAEALANLDGVAREV